MVYDVAGIAFFPRPYGMAMGGVDLGSPKVVYDLLADPDRLASSFLATVRGLLDGPDARGKMLVTAATLSTGRVVVGTTTAGWSRSNGVNGDFKDPYAALYEAGPRA